MDDGTNFLDVSNWTDDALPELPNELLNLSDHSDYAMESTADLMDWSSLFASEENKASFGDYLLDSSNNGKPFADFPVVSQSVVDPFSQLVEGFPASATSHLAPSSVDLNIEQLLQQQNIQLQNQVAAPPIQPQLLRSQTNQQTSCHSFVQQQNNVLPFSQQQFQQIIRQQIPQQQQQQIQVSFQPADSSNIFRQPSQIVVQQNPSNVKQQIVLQSSQLQQPTQIYIAQPQNLQTQQQQFCLASGQKVQLLQQQQQQPQQQMVILNGAGRSSSYIDTSQILLTQLQQQQQPIVVQQLHTQTPSIGCNTNQTVMVQIGNQIFQLQPSSFNENQNSVNNANYNLNRNTSNKTIIRSFTNNATTNMNNVTNHPNNSNVGGPFSGSTGTPNRSLGGSSHFTLKNVSGSPHGNSNLITPTSSRQTSLIQNCSTPVAKVRPLDSQLNKPDLVSQSKKIVSNSQGLTNREKLDLHDKLASAFPKSTTPHQKISQFDSTHQPIPPSSSIQNRTCNLSLPVSLSPSFPAVTSSDLVTNPAMKIDLKSHKVVSTAVSSNIITTSSSSSHSSSLNEMFLNSTSSHSSMLSSKSLVESTPLGCSSLSLEDGITSSHKQSHSAKNFLKMSLEDKFKIHLTKDQKSATQPDTKTAFRTLMDVLRTLAPYHVYQTKIDDEATVARADRIFEEMSCDLLEKKDQLFKKCQQVLLKKSIVHHESVEDVMLGRMFYIQEMARLKEEKKTASTDPGSFVPRPVLPEHEMARLFPKTVECSDDDDDDDEEDNNDDDYYEAEDGECSNKNNEYNNVEERNVSDQADKNKWSVSSCENSISQKDRNTSADVEKHIVIKIKHLDGTFSASQSLKRRSEDEPEKIPPVKIARIRLKRIDANDFKENKESSSSRSNGHFEVIGKETGNNPMVAVVSRRDETVSKSSNALSNITKQTITAVVVPFHKQQESTENQCIHSVERSLHHSFMNDAVIFQPESNLSLSYHNSDSSLSVKNTNSISGMGLMTGSQTNLKNNQNTYAQSLNSFEETNSHSMLTNHDYQANCNSLNIAQLNNTTDSIGSSLLFQTNVLKTNQNNLFDNYSDSCQMFPSDSDDFLDSSLEMEMQSAIQSILSLQRTE